MLNTHKPLPDCTIFLLAKAYQKAHGRFQEVLKPYGLTNLQHLFTTHKAEQQKAELIALRQKANEELLAGFSLEEQVLLKRMLRDLMTPEEG
jgi:hypothetical protein